MKIQILKIIICFLWIAAVMTAFGFRDTAAVKAENNFSLPTAKQKPDLKDVENFNSLIQRRFLEAPGFGIVRIQPTPPYSNHLSSFQAKDAFERSAVEKFEREGWKVGLYLYGKRAERKSKKGVEQKDFTIKYKIKQPVIISKYIKDREDLVNSAKIIKKVKESFSYFQDAKQSEEKNFEFESNGWWYFAKPVRAVNNSCVECHGDYVVVKQTDKNRYQFRPRKIGDVNGILVYAFKKK